MMASWRGAVLRHNMAPSHSENLLRIVPAMTKAVACLWLCFTVVLIGIATYIGLRVVPADADQGNVGRILYYHVPNWVAMSCCFFANLAASITYLASRNRSASLALMADAVAVSTAEVGLVFCSLGLITGSIWGRPAWGVWWAWDARLTSTALLFLLELGYLALRRVPADPAVRARRCAVAALLIALDVPIVHFSVDWWQTLHQTGTVLDPGFHLHVHGSMAWTFLLGFIAFSLIFVWLLGVRYRIEVLQDQVGDQEMEISLAERWNEGTELVGVGSSGPHVPEGGAP